MNEEIDSINQILFPLHNIWVDGITKSVIFSVEKRPVGDEILD